MLGTFALSSGYYEAYYGRARGVLRADASRARRRLRAGRPAGDAHRSLGRLPPGGEGGRSARHVSLGHLHHAGEPDRGAGRPPFPPARAATGCRSRSRSSAGRFAEAEVFRAARAFEREVGWVVAPGVPGSGGRARGDGAARVSRWAVAARLPGRCWPRSPARLPRGRRAHPTALVSPAPGTRAPSGCGWRTASRSRLSDEKGITVEAVAPPRRGPGRLRPPPLRRRGAGARKVAEANGGGSDPEVRAPAIRIPFDLLSPEWQLKASRALFADDRGEADGWRHKVRGVGTLQRESLWKPRSLVHRHGRELPRHPRVQRAAGRRRAARQPR